MATIMADRILQIQQMSVNNVLDQVAPERMAPGAQFLPTSIGSKLTLRNVGIGAGILAAAGLTYWLLLPKKRSAAAAPSVAGFGWLRRRRR